MTFDDPAFQFIPRARPLSDPRKAEITVKQLLNHTSGICPEATGAPNDGSWEYILGHSGDEHTAKLAFNPGKACGVGTPPAILTAFFQMRQTNSGGRLGRGASFDGFVRRGRPELGRRRNLSRTDRTIQPAGASRG